MNKISHYFTTLEITKGLGISVLGSAFIYLNYWGLTYSLSNTLLGVLFFYLLLGSNTKIWFISGALIGLFWFWWITLSFIHYEIVWAMPIALLVIMLSYGFIFAFIAWFAYKIPSLFLFKSPLIPLLIKSLGLLGLSSIHPFGFDWFRPELLFVESYFGITKISFFIILLAVTLTLWRRHYTYLLIVLLALDTQSFSVAEHTKNIALITTDISVKDKWDTRQHKAQFESILESIDKAISQKKSLIIFPESVFPIFLNHSPNLLKALEKRAKDISIIVGALYWDGKTPHNSSYIFTHNTMQVAHKVLLVPFGEENPLPDFLSDWVNKIFYDDAVDYTASTKVSDYTIDDITYRNAICFEATSEKLYEGHPEHMIVISNNGWFTPSIEPTLQKLLLQYYSRKYGTNIYHSVNMSASYVVQNGEVLE